MKMKWFRILDDKQDVICEMRGKSIVDVIVKYFERCMRRTDLVKGMLNEMLGFRDVDVRLLIHVSMLESGKVVVYLNQDDLTTFEEVTD